ncbi:Mitochondrial GTPase 1 [Wickerhamiella sorbophila]|uniref:Mitochondrial GTPase 1 n=1 Tax=Wickerhamiella sorbophila TaxID=45607 RepID=A0A2T0FGX3_9ASCO|nr:Mitochondrial GTPase 1 [Wickerhamiella sorbophila]PRT54235.1 Mitochondrial GTPase 1 [Wickerhamiella sorbophila]
MTFVPRQSFPLHNVVLANFHGHHRKALQTMRQLAFQVDMVLELRDARAPITSINPLFDRVLAGKPKLVLYTKADLSPLKTSQIRAWHPEQDFMKINCGDLKDSKRVMTYLKEKFGAMIPSPPLGTRLLITGMPNAGKSTFLNNLRSVGTKKRNKVARTGQTPGVTRNVSETVMVSESPKVFVYDTPGVFVPQAANSEEMLKLCLINAVNRTQVEPSVLADFLLYKLNLAYPSHPKYPGTPTNDLHVLLRRISKLKHYNYGQHENSVSLGWIDRWARGKVAKLCLDDVSVEAYNEALTLKQQQRIDLGNIPVSRDLRNRFMI